MIHWPLRRCRGWPLLLLVPRHSLQRDGKIDVPRTETFDDFVKTCYFHPVWFSGNFSTFPSPLFGNWSDVFLRVTTNQRTWAPPVSLCNRQCWSWLLNKQTIDLHFGSVLPNSSNLHNVHAVHDQCPVNQWQPATCTYTHWTCDWLHPCLWCLPPSET